MTTECDFNAIEVSMAEAIASGKVKIRGTVTGRISGTDKPPVMELPRGAGKTPSESWLQTYAASVTVRVYRALGARVAGYRLSDVHVRVDVDTPCLTIRRGGCLVDQYTLSSLFRARMFNADKSAVGVAETHAYEWLCTARWDKLSQG